MAVSSIKAMQEGNNDEITVKVTFQVKVKAENQRHENFFSNFKIVHSTIQTYDLIFSINNMIRNYISVPQFTVIYTSWVSHLVTEPSVPHKYSINWIV